MLSTPTNSLENHLRMTEVSSTAISIENDNEFSHNMSITNNEIMNSSDDGFQWTPSAVAQSVFLFVLAGVAEIMGGWMIWAAVRGNDKNGKRPWWFAILGGIVLVLYGFIPTFQPTDNFGRLYAAYGGAFIVLSFMFGWVLDGDRPDVGDVVGGTICLVGAAVVYFWPRTES